MRDRKIENSWLPLNRSARKDERAEQGARHWFRE